MAKEASGTLFFGLIQPPTMGTWDETWDDASHIFEKKDSTFVYNITAFLAERGVAWKAFG